MKQNRIKWLRTLELSVLNWMSSTNLSTQDLGFYEEEEAKDFNSQKGCMILRKYCLPDRRRKHSIWTHSDIAA